MTCFREEDERGRSERPSCFCYSFKLLQLKTVTLPRCCLLGQSHHLIEVVPGLTSSHVFLQLSQTESAAPLEKQIFKTKQPHLPPCHKYMSINSGCEIQCLFRLWRNHKGVLQAPFRMEINAQMKIPRTQGTHVINDGQREIPPLPGQTALLYCTGQRESAGGRKRRCCCLRARWHEWSQEGKEVRGEARAEGHNFIMNSCLF